MEESPNKSDYKPILEAGFHELSVSEIESIFVSSFPESLRRPLLFSNLNNYLKILERLDLSFTIWVDGSFLTTKSEPEDIDIVVLFDPLQVNNLTEDQENAFLLISDNSISRSRFLIDAYFVNKTNRDQKAYWRGLFGFLRDEVTPKGLVQLEINNG